MATDEVRITQTSDPTAYCRMYDGALFTNRDAESVSVAGTAFELWTDADDILYIGKATTFHHIGVTFDTVGVGYGTFTLEYWDGSSWSTLTAVDNTTSAFTVNGWVQWGIPGDWATTTVDSQSAYWMRISQSAVSPSTPATVYNVLPVITLKPPIVGKPSYNQDRYTRDITGQLKTTDLEYTGPTGLTIECSNITLSMADLGKLMEWDNYRRELFIEDLAQTAAGSFTYATNAFYRDYTGRIVTAPMNVASPHKMDAVQYVIEFAIDEISEVAADVLGVS